MAKNNYKTMAIESIFKNNPVFIQLLGMCPALAVTDSFEKGLGMGILVIIVLILSNTVVSLLKNLIDPSVKIPAFIVIIATFVTIIGMLTKAYLPDLSSKLGIFIPLIVVNCLVLGRAEAFASKNSILDSIFDGLVMGIGFTVALVLIGATREFLATGTLVFGNILPLVDQPVNLFTFGFLTSDKYGMELFKYAPGAFIVLGLYLALFKGLSLFIKSRQDKKGAK